MKKYIYPSILLSVLVAVPGVVYGAQGNGVDNNNQPMVQDVPTDGTDMPYAKGGQVQNQVATQNQGEESQLNVNTQSTEASGVGAGGTGAQTGLMYENTVARTQMNVVSELVRGFLASGDANVGVGTQIGDVVKQQQLAQAEIQATLGDIESRKGIMKTLFGYNVGAVKQMNKLMDQNQMRINQLEELKTQTQNQGEFTQLQEMIQAMMAQNTALQDQVLTELQVSSVFGWLIKLFN